MSKQEKREQKKRLPRDLERVLADLPGDPDAAPIMYRCREHGEIPPEEVNWFPDLQPKCPHCGKPLEKVQQSGP